MSIIHEALKKAAQDEVPISPPDGRRRFRFSSGSHRFSYWFFRFAGILILAAGIAAVFYFSSRNGHFGLLVSAGPSVFPKGKIISGQPVPATEKSPEASPIPLPDSPKSSPRIDKGPSHEALGIEYFKKQQFDLAVREFEAAALENPNSPSVLNNLGLALKALGREGAAEESYRKALAMAPEEVKAMNNLAILLEKQNRLGEAKGLYEKALALNPEFPEAHLNFAVFQEREGNFEEAKRHYQAFLGLASEAQANVVQMVQNHLEFLP